MIEISSVVGMFYLADIAKNELKVREKFTNSAFKGLEWTNLISQVSQIQGFQNVCNLSHNPDTVKM